MNSRYAKIAVLVIVTVIVGGGLVLLGRASVDTHAGRARQYATGHSDGYSAGLLAGEVQGRQEGRALQVGSELPAGSQQPAQDGFNAGYIAGVNDAFGGYDGGWALSMPYVITLVPGSGKVVYKFDSRTPMQADVDYYLCADGKSLCQEARH